MSRNLADELADKIAERLRPMLEVDSLPAHIGDMVRDTPPSCYRYWLPLGYGNGVQAVFTIGAGDALTLSLEGPAGERFWQHTLRSEATLR